MTPAREKCETPRERKGSCCCCPAAATPSVTDAAGRALAHQLGRRLNVSAETHISRGARQERSFEPVERVGRPVESRNGQRRSLPLDYATRSRGHDNSCLCFPSAFLCTPLDIIESKLKIAAVARNALPRRREPSTQTLPPRFEAQRKTTWSPWFFVSARYTGCASRNKAPSIQLPTVNIAHGCGGAPFPRVSTHSTRPTCQKAFRRRRTR